MVGKVVLVAGLLTATGCTLLYSTDELRPGPYIEQVSPERAIYSNDGTVTVEIRGSNFGGSPRVFIAWTEVEPTSASSTLIRLELPANYAFGAMDVTVQTDQGSWTESPGFFLYADQVGFEPHSSASVANGASWIDHADGFITDMAIGDFIGADQDLDLAVVMGGTGIGMPGGFLVLPGNGDGTFDDQNVRGGSTSGAGSDPREDNRAIAVGDFNGDDNLDAVIAQSCCTGSSAYVFYGDGGGGFEVLPVVSDGGATANRGAVAVATLERSSNDAFALYHSGDEGFEVLEVFHDNLASANDGLASTSRFAPNPAGTGPVDDEAFVFGDSTGNAIAAADFDRDGEMDLIAPVSRTPRDFPVAVGDMGTPVHGFALFTANSSSIDLANQDPVIERLEGFDMEGGGFRAMTATDVNFDYLPDVVGIRSNMASEVWTIVGQQWGSFEYTPKKTTLNHDASDIAVADVNGDGMIDLWTCYSGPSSPSAHAYLYLGNDDGGFDTVPEVELTLDYDQTLPGMPQDPSTTSCDDLVAGDFDGDGLPDLAVAVAQRNQDKGFLVEEWAFSVRVYLNTSDESQP